jgi:hypothetical protein
MATNAELEPASLAVFCAMLANPCFLVTVTTQSKPILTTLWRFLIEGITSTARKSGRLLL